MPKQISDEDLLDEIRIAHTALGRPPTWTEMDMFGEYDPQTHRKRFGSWNEAIEAAGFEPREPGVVFSTGDLIAAIEHVAEEIGYVPGWGDYARYRDEHDPTLPAPQTIANRFDDWPAAIDAADLDDLPSRPEGRRRDYTDDDLLDAIEHVAEEIGHAPGSGDYARYRDEHDPDLPSMPTITKRFGGWDDALDAAERARDSA